MSEIKVIDDFLNEEDFEGLKEIFYRLFHGLSAIYYLTIELFVIKNTIINMCILFITKKNLSVDILTM